MLKQYYFIVLYSFCFVNFVNSRSMLEEDDSSLKILSRRKRYISFPEGSSFSCAGCVTLGVIGQPAPITTPGVFTFGLNWGMAYELPNETMTKEAIYLFKGKRFKPVVMRRNRRDLYRKIETVIDTMGYDGRICILKTLCETTQRILPGGANVFEEIFRIIFSLPITKMFLPEDAEMEVYNKAHKIGLMMQDCDRQYRGCPLSLVDLVKGYYNAKSNTNDFMNNPLSLFMPSAKL